MAPEPEDRPPAREIRLEGPGLWLAAGLLLVLAAGSFWLGRAYERATSPAPTSPAADPLANVSKGADDVPDDATFFDTLGGGGRAAEPEREARTRTADAPAPVPAAVPQAGPFVVQVFAGRDRGSAEELVASLRGKGYPVRMEGEREGRGTLYRVRVGGYATRAEAEAAVERLVKDGQAGAWVTRGD
jgi:cell division septation protein DedD